MTVKLRGNLAHAARVKAFELPPGCVSWRNEATHVELPPGEQIELFLEGDPSVGLAVEATLHPPRGEREQHSEVLVRSQLVEGWRLEFLQGSWQSGDLSGAGVATGVETKWQGQLMELPEDPAEADQELRKQLEELGYLG